MSEQKLDPNRRDDEEHIMHVLLIMARQSLDPCSYDQFVTIYQKLAKTRHLNVPQIPSAEDGK